MSVLYLDLETYHETENLRVVGSYRYAVGAEVMLAAWAWGDDLPVVWDFTTGDHEVSELQALIDAADTVVVHNSSFERIVLHEQGIDLPFAKIEDTAVIALQHGLVKALDKLCPILGVPESESKIKEGTKLITLFCSPCPKNWKLRRATAESHPDEWGRFKAYAAMDVVSMREVARRLPRWNCTPTERRYFELDQVINDRGFKVDVELATAARRAFDKLKNALAVRTKEITGGAISSTTEVAKLVEYLQAQGLTIHDMTKDTVEGLLARDDIRPDLRELLEIRQQASLTTPAKFGSLLKAMSADGRLRGTLQYCGAARTGRDAGRIYQPQNQIRTPDWFDELVQELVVIALKEGVEDLLWEDIADRVAFAVRGSMIVEDGCVMLAADLSNIEGRVLAWLAGEDWKVRAFADYDKGEGDEIYKITAGLILGKPAKEVTKDERQKYGKVSELSLGFQGAVGAFRKMGGAMAEAMTDDEILEIVRPWRARHPRTKGLWYAMDAAARKAVDEPGVAFVVDKLTFDCLTDDHGLTWLRLKLPSGRYLCYLRPDTGFYACAVCDGSGVLTDNETCFECGGKGVLGNGEFTYEGVDQKTKQWGARKTYGGSFVENATQAVARDVFFHGLVKAEEAGYPVILRVHDELVAEVPDDGTLTADGLAACMTILPRWASGLPLAAAGFEALRYRKD